MVKLTKKDETLSLNLSVNRYMLAGIITASWAVMSYVITIVVDLLMED